MEYDSNDRATRGQVAGGGNTGQHKNRAGYRAVGPMRSKDEPWTMVVGSDGHPLTFHTMGFFAFGFSDTLWWGEDHFSTCQHIEGLRAIVRYQPAANTSYTGDAVEIDVRDDLPPAENAAGNAIATKQ